MSHLKRTFAAFFIARRHTFQSCITSGTMSAQKALDETNLLEAHHISELKKAIIKTQKKTRLFWST